MLKVRDATIADRDLLARLGAATYRSHFTAIWSPGRLEAYIAAEYASAALEQSLAGPDVCLWLIAELGAEPIGFAKLNWNRAPPASQEIGTELQKIYLLAEYTGKSHGGTMLQAVIDRSKAHGSALLWLDVLKSNAGARAFYERHGFKTIAEIPFATDLTEIGMWVMVRAV